MSSNSTTVSAPMEGNICLDVDEIPSRVEDKHGKKRVWESNDFTITKIVHNEGDRRSDLPRFGATGQIKLDRVSCTGLTTEQLTNDFFYSKYFNKLHSGEVQLGNADSEIDKTLEKCLQSMYVREKSEVALRVKVNLKLNGGVTDENDEEKWIEIEAFLQLDSLLNAQPIYKWYAETKFDKAKEANNSAIILFKTRRTLDAFHKFHLTLTLLNFVLEESKDEELKKQAEEMRMTALSNLAACQFQFKNFKYVISLASKVLESQPSNVKLLYRRGVAYLEVQEFDQCRDDLVEAHRLDPSNKAINDKMGQLRIAETKYKNQMAGNMKKLFA